MKMETKMLTSMYYRYMNTSLSQDKFGDYREHMLKQKRNIVERRNDMKGIENYRYNYLRTKTRKLFWRVQFFSRVTKYEQALKKVEQSSNQEK